MEEEGGRQCGGEVEASNPERRAWKSGDLGGREGGKVGRMGRERRMGRKGGKDRKNGGLPSTHALLIVGFLFCYTTMQVIYASYSYTIPLFSPIVLCSQIMKAH